MIQDPKNFPETNQEFFLSGPSGKLQCFANMPQNDEVQAIAVVCHPHPLHGGTMNNKVVTTIARAFNRLGLASVRFNYRGVMESEGTYADTIGEALDLRAVMAFIMRHKPNHAIFLAGFSFGTVVVMRASDEPIVSQVLLVAPPVNHYNFAELKVPKAPRLIIQGDQDEVVPAAEVYAWANAQPAPLQLISVPETSHFFHGKLIELNDIIVNHYQKLIIPFKV